MARLSTNICHAIVATVTLSWQIYARAGNNGIIDDIPDPEAVHAFKQYWNAFEVYESNLIQQGRKNFAKSWEELKRNYAKEQAKFDSEQLAKLQKAAKNYRIHLQEHPNVENRPYVLLNLAQINFLIGSKLATTDEIASSFAKTEAISQLKEIEQNFPGFSYREQAFYLRAIILDSMNRPDEALVVWNALAGIARESIYGIYAHLAVGDHYFARDLASEALPSYKKAVELLTQIEVEDP